LEATEEIAKLRLNSRVLIFTMHDSGSLAKAVRKAGARGCVLKSRASRDLIRAIEALLDGGTFWGPGLGAEAENSKPSEGSNFLLLRAFQCTRSAQLAASLC
jgi:DNA-binding NarL/FixJ family response regulator